MRIRKAVSVFAILTVVSVGSVGTLAVSPGLAQSFSCANAQIPSEMAVCNNEQLLIKDEKLAELLADAIIRATGTDKVQKLSAQHGSWLKQRNTCRVDFECLGVSYDKRIQELVRDASPLLTASVSDRF